MKEKILIAVIIILTAALCIQSNNIKNTKGRYEVVPTATVTVLVDKTTGETWRNSICSKESPIPGCWEKMSFVHEQNFILPIGEQRIRETDLPKYIKEQKKKEAEAQKAAEKANPNPNPSATPFQQGQPQGNVIQLGGPQQ